MLDPKTDKNEYRFTIQEGEGGSLASYLKERCGLSSRVLRSIKKNGILEVNGIHAKVNSEAYAGDEIRLVLPGESLDADPSSEPFDILYEDDEILAVSKTPELVVHPTRTHPDGTLANRIAFYAQDKGEAYKIRFVNRLDRDTSGVLIVAKNKFVHHFIQSRMRTEAVRKEYLVWVEDSLEDPIPEEGTITLPIGRPDPESIMREIMPDGQEAITHYRVEQRMKGVAKLRVVLETGRTHQIRVHLKAIGHPIIGDPLYNPESIQKFGIGRQALHAYKLTLSLPKRDRLTIEAPLPEDILALEERLSD